MNISFLGAARQVTGSCFLLEGLGQKILIDCGMAQGPDLFERQTLNVFPPDIDCVLLTHAHIDHSGLLPLLTSSGFRGVIHTTSATKRLCDIMLRDAGHIQEMETRWDNKKAIRNNEELAEPLYTVEDAVNSMKYFRPHEYNEEFALGNGNIIVKFVDAGHILGSAHIIIKYVEDGEEKTIVFSGDIGNENRPMINDPTPITKADYIIMESTYGDRDHEQRIDAVATLANIFRETFARGGNVVIPSFAVGRTQELLYFIRQIKEKNLVKQHPNFKVYLDSPLAIEATSIFENIGKQYYDEETLKLLDQHINPISFPDLVLSVTSEDSKLINEETEPCVIISASGMCEAGRIRHHLKHNLWRPECTILFVGYQVIGTLGFSIMTGARKVKIAQEEIAVNAKILTLSNSSAHADRTQLVSWLSHLEEPPKRIFLVHGQDRSIEMLSAKIEGELGFNVTAPYFGEEYNLNTNALEKEKVIRIRKVKAIKPSLSDTMYKKLTEALKHLQNIVLDSEGRPNKEKERFANQIENLANKWEHTKY